MVDTITVGDEFHVALVDVILGTGAELEGGASDPVTSLGRYRDAGALQLRTPWLTDAPNGTFYETTAIFPFIMPAHFVPGSTFQCVFDLDSAQSGDLAAVKIFFNSPFKAIADGGNDSPWPIQVGTTAEALADTQVERNITAGAGLYTFYLKDNSENYDPAEPSSILNPGDMITLEFTLYAEVADDLGTEVGTHQTRVRSIKIII